MWVSLDGTSYKQVGTINGPSRYCVLNGAPSGGVVHVSLIAGALTSGSAADAAALNTLCYIGGASREYFSFSTATLTAALAYDLTAATPGAYSTTTGGHASGDPFVRVDSSIAKSGPIDLGYIGKTLHVKCTSFNVYGAAEESLASVTDYVYAITGSQVLGNAGASALAGIGAAVSDGVLSAGEKPAVILDYNTILANQGGIDAQAAAYGKDHTPLDTAITALTNYLGTLTTPVLWRNLSGSTTADGPTTRAMFLAVYAAQQSLLNATAAAAGTVATWAGVGNRPATYRAVSAGYSATSQPTPAALYNSETGAVISYLGRSYNLTKILRSTGEIIYSNSYDVYGVGAGRGSAATLAVDLNACTSAHIVVVISYDEPATNRLTAGMDSAMYRCGASRGVFGSPNFQGRSAYTLIGVGGCGEGQGYEAYAGAIASDPNAWTDTTFTIQNGGLIVSGTSATPKSLEDYGAGALATLNTIDTPQITDNAVTYTVQYVDAAGVYARSASTV